MPPSASRKAPRRWSTAPVKAPRRWPKSSLSARPAGSELQSTTMNGLALRGEAWWMERASTSLPVPVSPRSTTVASLLATAVSSPKSLRMAALFPTASWNDGTSASRGAPRSLSAMETRSVVWPTWSVELRSSSTCSTRAPER